MNTEPSPRTAAERIFALASTLVLAALTGSFALSFGWPDNIRYPDEDYFFLGAALPFFLAFTAWFTAMLWEGGRRARRIRRRLVVLPVASLLLWSGVMTWWDASKQEFHIEYPIYNTPEHQALKMTLRAQNRESEREMRYRVYLSWWFLAVGASLGVWGATPRVEKSRRAHEEPET